MNLTGKEAAWRIREYNKIHQHKEPLNSPIITEILEVAAVLFEKVDAGDYQVVKHGRWIVADDGVTRCSICYGASDYERSFCGDCGAKMDLEEKKNEKNSNNL